MKQISIHSFKMISSLNVVGRRDCTSSIIIIQNTAEHDRLRRQVGQARRLLECRYRGIPS